MCVVIVTSRIGHVIEGNVKSLVVRPQIPFIDGIILGKNQNCLCGTPVIRRIAETQIVRYQLNGMGKVISNHLEEHGDLIQRPALEANSNTSIISKVFL